MAETAVPLTIPDMEEHEDRASILQTTAHPPLLEHEFNKAWIRQLELASTEIALRIWIVDNSASMSLCDRYRLETSGSPNIGNPVRRMKCTRWEELKETALYHAQLAVSLKAPTLFRLVSSCPNIPQEYHMASLQSFHKDRAQQDLHYMERCFQSIVEPSGRTLLTHSIYETQLHIVSMKDSLRAKSQYVALILATDGMPSDEGGQTGSDQAEMFIHALRMLEDLSVVLIVRLCTDDKQVRHFYSELRYRVKLRIIILNDFISEADQIQRVNEWMTYTSPIHRIREFGHVSTSLQHVSERLLTHVEMRDACIFLLGYDSLRGILDPVSDWHWFIQDLKHSISRQRDVLDPCRNNQPRPLIDIRQLTHAYRPARQRRRCTYYLREKVRLLFMGR